MLVAIYYNYFYEVGRPMKQWVDETGVKIMLNGGVITVFRYCTTRITPTDERCVKKKE
jgi:hypothetical protein